MVRIEEFEKGYTKPLVFFSKKAYLKNWKHFLDTAPTSGKEVVTLTVVFDYDAKKCPCGCSCPHIPKKGCLLGYCSCDQCDCTVGP
jgi:hypothetical protein